MKIPSYQLSLGSFEGSLELLFHLIKKKEMEISEIKLKEITGSFIIYFSKEDDVFDSGSDFILLTSQLTLLKSRSLLPVHTPEENTLSVEEDPRFDIIHHLIDYVKFKEAASLFSVLEEKQDDLFTRGIKEDFDVKLPLGLDTVSLEELGALFNTLLSKAKDRVGFIEEEEFRVQDKILWIRSMKESQKIPFLLLFKELNSKVEMIVTFLAILELLKNGELKVIKEDNILIICYEKRN